MSLQVLPNRLARAAQASNLGGGAEVDGFSKTLSSLDISIQTSDFIIVFVLALVLVVLVMALASSNLLRKQPKELLLMVNNKLATYSPLNGV